MQPHWLTDTLLLYVSGTTLVRYDFVSREIGCLVRDE
jgi:hypothetical protein